jgi:hypothetical protein
VTTPVETKTLLNSVTTPVTGSSYNVASKEERNFVCSVEGTGAVSATVLLEASNNNQQWFTLATFSLSGTDSDADGYVSDDAWQFIRAKVTAVSGTGAAVTMTMAV